MARRQPPQPHQQPNTNDKEITVAMIGLRGSQWLALSSIAVAIIGCMSVSFFTPLVSVLMNKFLVAATPTVTVTPLPTPSPSPTQAAFLYHTDFSQGSQGWLNSSNAQQWTYNSSEKVLESDGSDPCCTPQTQLQKIVLVAPYTMQTSDYAVEAQIRVKGLNSSHPYSKDQPPFFGLYARGDDVNGQGYMASISWIESTPNGTTNADGPRSSLIAFGPNPQFYDLNKGGEKYRLNTQWHTYRFEVKGETFMLKIDGTPVYTYPIQDTLFSSGARVGIENYNCLLQVKSFTVYPL